MIIFGTSTFSKLMKWYVENDTLEKVEAFTVEKEYMTEQEILGIPVLPFEELENTFDKGKISILNTCGYHNMNDIRKKVFEMCKEKGYKLLSFVHSTAILNGLQCGEGNIILEKVLFQPYVQIGSCNIFAPDILVGHDSIIGDFNYFSSGVKICGICNIGNQNFVGTSAVLKERLIMQDYNLVGAGTFLNIDLKEFMATAPAISRIKQLSKENLDRLINR